MNAKIENQVNLMHEALEEIRKIKTIEALFSGVDDDHVNGERKKHEAKYAEIMARLVLQVKKDAGVTDTLY